MSNKKPKKSKRTREGDRLPVGTGYRSAVGLRIVGGEFRGRKLKYSGELGTRPMKDRVREAVFNLIGPTIREKHAIDLFAGTGALGLEAISRGATDALLIERHLPTAQFIEKNIETLKVESRTKVIIADTFQWIKRNPQLPEEPWVVFISPPYHLFVELETEMMGLMNELFDRAPADSIFIVESDDRFNFDLLPDIEDWRRRSYPPAEVGVWFKP